MSKLSFTASSFVPSGAPKVVPAELASEPAKAPVKSEPVKEEKSQEPTCASKEEPVKKEEPKPEPTKLELDASKADEIPEDDAELQAELRRVAEEEAADAAPVKGPAAVGKEHVNVVFIGHVDHGKSTLSGAILLACNMVDKREIQKLQSEAEAEGRESWWKAYLMDTNPEERSKGKTQETARSHFETERKLYTILDAPGHKAYVPSMISGAAQADVAVLVVSARQGEFEDGFQKAGQTKEHTLLVRTMGVTHIVVVVNKMDDKTVEWSEKRFNDLQNHLSDFLKRTGFKKDQVSFVPISALSGANLLEPVSKEECPWYKGDSLLNTLDSVASAREYIMDAPVRVPVLDRYKDSGKVFVIGRVDGNTVKVGDTLVVVPGEKEAVVGGIESEFGSLQEARPGDNVTMWLKGMDEAYINSGSVLCTKGKRLCPAVSRFQAQIIISNLPDSRPILSPGYQCVMHLHTCTTEVTIEKIVSVLDKKTGKPIKGQAFARKGAAVVVNISTPHPIAVEKYEDFNPLSRILLRDEELTIGIGKVLKIAAPGKDKK